MVVLGWVLSVLVLVVLLVYLVWFWWHYVCCWICRLLMRLLWVGLLLVGYLGLTWGRFGFLFCLVWIFEPIACLTWLVLATYLVVFVCRLVCLVCCFVLGFSDFWLWVVGCY